VADSSSIDFETSEQFILQVQVEDDQFPSLKAKSTVTVNITDEEEITDGLIAYYPFDGNANDASGNGIEGQLNGPTLTTDRNQDPESAYLFDGVNDYINLANSEALHFGNQDFSISVWYEFPLFEIGPQDVISIYSSAGNNREFRVATYPNKDLMYFEIFDQGGSIGDLMAFPRVDGWQHVTITKSSSTIRLYINGAMHSEKSVTASIITTGSRALIGAVDKSNTSPDSFFEGKIDDIYIHDRVLGAEEVKSLYHRK
jgi:hypothetical protein